MNQASITAKQKIICQLADCEVTLAYWIKSLRLSVWI